MKNGKLYIYIIYLHINVYIFNVYITYTPKHTHIDNVYIEI